MAPDLAQSQSLWHLIGSGGFAMYPLLLCSVAVWGVVFERLWSYRKLGRGLEVFYARAENVLLRGERDALKNLCRAHSDLPTAQLVTTALERLEAKNERLRSRWLEAVERRRLGLNHDLKRNLWVLGTVASAAPFIGLFGTVVGILRSFENMARTGTGGFAVVAAGISESLIATASGIVVAVVAVMAYNAFQTRLGTLVLSIRTQTEELTEMLGAD